ncbi:hypothetical protein [Streptomyces specialis]|uniref:hypothetical protein n=1 Tax=Streptomyces specialis TaxID=498367 RepID=UPI00073E2685|nr:hypothetical protein [Streptomyces specialis]
MAVIRGELEALRAKVAAAESSLNELEVARKVLRMLPAAVMAHEEPEAEPDQPGQRALESDTDEGSGEQQSGLAKPVGLEEGRERMLVLLAGAGRAMKVRDIAAAIGEDVSVTSRVETTRSRLKRLTTEGRVVEGPVGWFAIASTSGERMEGGA